MTNANTSRYRTMRRATLIGAAVNVLLAVIKGFFGWLAQSNALLADAIHSLADLATDAVVLVAAKHGSAGADEEHPYGHARIETAFTVALGLLLIAIAFGIIVDAGQRLLAPERLLQPTAVAMLAAALSIGAKEALYHYTRRVARAIRSPLLRANAWHHRSDAISSVVVLVGVAGSLLGYRALDAFAAAGVALMIAKIGWDQARQSLQELVDRGLEPEQLATIRATIEEVEGVVALHSLRTRRMGGEALVDVHVQVSPRLSVSEGHQIGEYVRTELLKNVDEVNDVTVHVDPEDDESSYLCATLPLRRDLVQRLRARWQDVVALEQIQTIDLHYLSGKVDVELVLPLALVADADSGRQLADAIRHAVRHFSEIGAVKVYFA